MVSVIECGSPQAAEQPSSPPPPTTHLSDATVSDDEHGSSVVIKHSYEKTLSEDNRVSSKSAVSQRSIELQIGQQKTLSSEKSPNEQKQSKINSKDEAKRNLKLDLVKTTKSIDEFSIKSPKSPLANSVRSGRLPHQTSLTAQVDLVEDRKTLRDALYQGIFHRHRRTIFAVGSFLRMLRSRNSQYNTIRSSSEGEDIDDSTR